MYKYSFLISATYIPIKAVWKQDSTFPKPLFNKGLKIVGLEALKNHKNHVK